MVSRLVASVWCKPTRAAGVRRAALDWAVRRMALHTMAIARPQPDCRFASWSSLTRLVARVHSLACAVIVRPGVTSSLVCCAPRVASGCYAGRSGLSVRRSGALRFLRGASDSGGARAMIYHGARATPTLFTLRTHVLQPARSGACGSASLSWISMVARAGSSLGRWRCGSCVAVRLIALGFARLGRLPG